MPWKRVENTEMLHAKILRFLSWWKLTLQLQPMLQADLDPIFAALAKEAGTQATFAPTPISLEWFRCKYLLSKAPTIDLGLGSFVSELSRSKLWLVNSPKFFTEFAEAVTSHKIRSPLNDDQTFKPLHDLVLRLSQHENVLKVIAILEEQPMLATYFNCTITSTIQSLILKPLPEIPNAFVMILIKKTGDDIDSSSLLPRIDPLDASSGDWGAFIQRGYSEWGSESKVKLEICTLEPGAAILIGKSDDLIAILDNFCAGEKNNSDYLHMKKGLLEAMRGYLQQDNAVSCQSSSNEIEMTASKYPRWKRNTVLEQLSQEDMQVLQTQTPESFDIIMQVKTMPATLMAELKETQQALKNGWLKGITTLAFFEANHIPECPVQNITLMHRPNYVSKPFQLILHCRDDSESTKFYSSLSAKVNTQTAKQSQSQVTIDVFPHEPKIILDVIAILAQYSGDTAYLQETLTSLLQNPQSYSPGGEALLNESIISSKNPFAFTLTKLPLTEPAATVQEASTSTASTMSA